MNDKELMRHVRTSLGLTQDKMAELVGYNSKDAISKIETGKRGLSGPARNSLKLLAEMNGVQL